jgi:hypothetical protein
MQQQPFEMHPKDWNELADCFPGNFPYVDHDAAPEGCEWRVIHDWERYADDLKRAEAPYRADIEAAILSFCTTGTLLLKSPAERYFFGLRAAAVSHFVSSLSVRSNSSQSDMVPFPTGTPFLSIVRGMLIGWWNTHGYAAVCRTRVFEDQMPND